MFDKLTYGIKRPAPGARCVCGKDHGASNKYTVKRRQGDVPWDAMHRTLKLKYQPRRKVYTDDAVIAEPV